MSSSGSRTTPTSGTSETRKRLDLPSSYTVENLFFGGPKRLLIRSDERIILYDLIARKVLSELNCCTSGPGKVRQAIWSRNGGYLALLSKHYVILTNSNLEQLSTAHECIRIKSGAWDDHNVFIYNTVSHIKYIFANKNDNGIFQSLPDKAVYIQYIYRDNLIFLTRRSTIRQVKLNNHEQLLKLALNDRNMESVAALLKSRKTADIYSPRSK